MSHNKKSRSYRALVFRQLKKNKLAVAGGILIVILFIIALLAPLLANEKPLVFRTKTDLANGQRVIIGRKIYFPALADFILFKFANWFLKPTEFGFFKYAELNYFDFKNDVPADAFKIMPLIPYSPATYDLTYILSPPDKVHLLGTNDTGQDILSRMLYGSGVSLTVGFVSAGIALIIGVIVGATAGYYQGKIDIVLSRIIEVVMCFPSFFLILTVIAFLPPSIYNVMLVIGITGWTGVARLVRGEFLRLKGQDFVVAAIALGASDIRVIFRHILPNAMTPVLISATFRIAHGILTESALSFLGFGVQPPTPSWGAILSLSQRYPGQWWLATFPGIAIFLTVTAYNLFGEGLRDALDPRLKI